MLGHMTILAGITTVLALILLIYIAKKSGIREAAKYVLIGLAAALIDFTAEFIGISFGRWHYDVSIYFLKGLVPIELPIIFFSFGILLVFSFLNLSKIKLPIKLNTMLYLTIIFSTIAFLVGRYLGFRVSSLLIAVPVGIWGMLNIREKNRPGAFLIVLIIAGFDFLAESIIISAGGYSYKCGYTLLTPLMYGLFVLGILGIIERLNKLDAQKSRKKKKARKK